MDEKEKEQGLPQEEELSEFSLEDILKEFGGFEDTGETPAEPEEDDVRVWDGMVSPTATQQPPVQDTVRLDDITKQVKQMEGASQETVRFTPVNGEPEEEELPPVPAQEEKGLDILLINHIVILQLYLIDHGDGVSASKLACVGI